MTIVKTRLESSVASLAATDPHVRTRTCWPPCMPPSVVTMEAEGHAVLWQTVANHRVVLIPKVGNLSCTLTSRKKTALQFRQPRIADCLSGARIANRLRVQSGT